MQVGRQVEKISRKKVKQKLLLLVGPGIANLLLRLLIKTVRLTVIGEEHFNKHYLENNKAIFALWHGRMLLPILHNIDRGIHALASRHNDGEIITRIIEKLGFKCIRGSSTRGGAEALLEMIEVMKEGAGIAITPDGPKGPLRELKMGTVVLAQRSGAPIIPISAYAENPLFFSSWDRFMTLKPFGKAVVIYGEPVFVPKDITDKELEEQRKMVENRIKQSDERAENYFRK